MKLPTIKGSDPLTERISGITYHGHVPFDMPFMTPIADHLWQGGVRTGLVLPPFIAVVVSLYQRERYTVQHDLEWYEKVHMNDSHDESYQYVDELAHMVNYHRAAGRDVLVHCQAGLNRSSLIVARALMLAEEMTAADAIALIRAKRSPAALCNEAFEAYLLHLK